jgi:hypothetical protein
LKDERLPQQINTFQMKVRPHTSGQELKAERRANDESGAKLFTKSERYCSWLLSCRYKSPVRTDGFLTVKNLSNTLGNKYLFC